MVCFSFLSKNLSRPLSLLYGPRQFGKTTIAHRLGEEIENLPFVCYVCLRLTKDSIQTETAFWNIIGRDVGRKIDNEADLEMYLSVSNKRLCIFIDEFDLMFQNESLSNNFIDIISRWQTASYFYGFLGIGSYELLNLHLRHKGNEKISPFNLTNTVAVKPFSVEQMSNFFELISLSYDFTIHTRLEIMAYSSGAAGVFGSSIAATIDADMWKCEFRKWYSWFNLLNFPEYLSMYNWTYKRIQGDLQCLDDPGWDALVYLMKYHTVFPSQVPYLNFEILLLMGVVIKTKVGETIICSEMMRRICMEALPVREIDQVVSGDDPIDLLALAICWMKADVIGHALVANRQSPSEAVFQFELYAAIRGIFEKKGGTRKVLPEARDVGEIKQRLNIIISNGSKYGFVLKTNKLRKRDIEAAVKQADDYRKRLDIDKMFVVNFVRRSHEMDDLYQIDGYQDIKIIHVIFPDTCNEYDITFLGDQGAIESRHVSTKL